MYPEHNFPIMNHSIHQLRVFSVAFLMKKIPQKKNNIKAIHSYSLACMCAEI